jgi:hypothetical protein
MQTVGGFDEAPGGDDFYKSSGEFDVHVFIALLMLRNVNEIRLFALLFDERVLLVTRIREPDALVYAQAGTALTTSAFVTNGLVSIFAQEEEIEPDLHASAYTNVCRGRLSSGAGCHPCRAP